MKKLLIVAHAPSPNTKKLIDILLQRARGIGDALTIDRLSPFDTGPDELNDADGIILFTTENFGYMSGALKDFFDRTYNSVIETKRGMPYVLVVRAGKDGTGARRSVEAITKGLGWKKVQEALTLKGNYVAEFEDKIGEIGEAFALGLSEGMF